MGVMALLSSRRFLNGFRSSVLALVLLAAVPAHAEENPAFILPVEGSLLRNATDFWIQIYSKYTTEQGVIHDAKDLRIIYEVVSFKGTSRAQSKAVKSVKEKYKKLLMKLHHLKLDEKPERIADLSEEEKRVYDLFLDTSDKSRFLNAAHFKRLRFQLGQKDRMLAGIKESGRYLPFMEEIFTQAGLPLELTRLPFVESSFNTRARSKVGASGIWQFMRTTGKHYLRITNVLDERNDPLRATEAASKLLKTNFDSLGSWALAVTAYNHGRTGIMKAVRKLGTENLEEIIESNKSRSFGFASSNFFACLLAAIEVERNSEKYFGQFDRERPHFFYEVELPNPILMKNLVRFMGVNEETLVDLNPGFASTVVKNHSMIPAKYRLRLPMEGLGTTSDKEAHARVFLAGFEKIPDNFRGITVKKKKGS